MIDFGKLNWVGDFMSDEMGYEEGFVVGHYTIKEFPTVNLIIDATSNKIINAFIDIE